MSKNLKIFAIILLILVAVFLIFSLIKKNKPDMTASLNTANSSTLSATSSADMPVIKHLQISSSAFENNQTIPVKYTCDGDDINPPLTVQNIPAQTKSLALIVNDPDAARGGWTHWLLWNLLPSGNSFEIKEGIVPNEAVQGLNSYSRRIYKGPCPPIGTHHYYFTVYALDIEPVLSISSDESAVERAIAGHILEQAELIGLYR